MKSLSDQPLVSIIIPTYNRATLCKRAVMSVLGQSYPHVEVIVVDDGSGDDTKQILTSLDDRIVYIEQENAGVCAARNRGIQAAQGEFVAFLDSDDLWLRDKLAAQLDVFRYFPEVGMVWTDMTAINENGQVIHESYLKIMYRAYKFFDPEKNFKIKIPVREVLKKVSNLWSDKKCYAGNIFSWMFMGNLVHTSTVMLTRERLKSVGLFDLDLQPSGEDYDFHFRTCRQGEVACLDIPLIQYQIGAPDQLTVDKYGVWIARNDLKTVLKMMSVAKSEIAVPEKLLRKRIAWSYAWIGRKELFDDPQSARGSLRQGVKYNPLQPEAVLMYFLTLLPLRVLQWLREFRRALKSFIMRK